MKNQKPDTLTLRKEILRICAYNYLEAHLLEFFLSGSFNKTASATLEEICERIFLTLENATKVRSSIKRLLDKGYIKDVTVESRTWRKRGDPKFWIACVDVVERDIKRLTAR